MATIQASEQLVVKVAAEKAAASSGLWADALRRLLRNRMAVLGAIFIIFLVLLAIFAPNIAPKGYDEAVLSDNNAAPAWMTVVFPTMKSKDNGGYVTINGNYLLGADKLGRDLFSLIIFGTRISLAVAFIGPFISIVVGILVGLTAGYVGGQVDNILMRSEERRVG